MRLLSLTVSVVACFFLACSASTSPTADEGNSGTCTPGQPCSCVGNGSCDKTCSGAGCTVDCNGNGSCNVSCPQGGCTINCNGTGSCNFLSCASKCTCNKIGVGACNGAKP